MGFGFLGYFGGVKVLGVIAFGVAWLEILEVSFWRLGMEVVDY